jgi:topoisomerase IA-like protein
MNSEYTLQTGKIMKTVNGKVVLNKQFAFDYDGEKANIVLKNNKDLHEYKLTNKDINDLFTKVMNNKEISLKERLQIMLDKETKQKKSKKKQSKKKKSTKKNKAKSKQNKNKRQNKTKKKQSK